MSEIPTDIHDERALAGDLGALARIEAARLSPGTRVPASGLRKGLSAHWLLEGTGYSWMRLVVDFVMSLLGVVAAVSGAAAAGVEAAGEATALYALPLLVVGFMWARGLYKRTVRVVILDRVVPVVGAVSVASMSVIAFEMFAQPDTRPGPVIARAWFFTLLFVGTGRVSLALAQRQARAQGYVGRPTVIVGAGHVGAQVARRIEDHPEYGLRPIGFLDADPIAAVDSTDRRVPVLGTPDDLSRISQELGIEHVILAFSSAPDRGLIPLTRQCEELGLEVSLVPRLFESINDRVALERLGGLPLLGLRSVDPKGWQFNIKYTLDRLAAALGLIACAPLLLVVALAVRLSSPGPILFRQRRMGRDGHEFDLLKFRSMRIPDESAVAFTPAVGSAPGGIEGVDRRTPVGRFLRRSSLDELPQLYNVLRGDMSLIGPRPERPEFVELFRQDLDRYADRHRVKSGITGWAQVHGLRGQTSLADRVEWDNFYIENWSLWLDLKILLLTIGAVLRSGE
ncbi:MAG: Undecaprenyl-phosphate galactosephosphotransferase [uncultured Solirubrobacteraceae bacterium]|uniref:Undecaprenyl-phosphate galactosephosphotransferase n=1 Tax=uncultured Solirubrobacteraceae bacterium TaxID=1162706 RepID=A0A6J4SEE6_9ACTN|nr:MAG: Undecaprenyl-phosphate galactosephosphotransferase [uncultured Solirubrobacteraceae bacterium]